MGIEFFRLSMILNTLFGKRKLVYNSRNVNVMQWPAQSLDLNPINEFMEWCENRIKGIIYRIWIYYMTLSKKYKKRSTNLCVTLRDSIAFRCGKVIKIMNE